MSFVTVNLIGPGSFGEFHNFGLGNQLFQIATTLSYAKDNNLQPIFPDLNNPKYGNYKSNIFRKLDSSNYKEDQIECEYFEPHFNYCELPIKKNIRLNGYFQSYKYFKKNIHYIKSLFLPSDNMISKLKVNYSDTIKNSVACHIRLGDYTILQNHHLNLHKTNYYTNALNKIEYDNIVVFSDDIQTAKQIDLKSDKSISFIQTSSDIEDLYLMSLFRKIIISNSTFSWWAAWLNSIESKVIYYPDKWFGHLKKNNTQDMTPKQWNKISVL